MRKQKMEYKKSINKGRILIMSLNENQKKEYSRLINLSSKISLAHMELISARNYIKLMTNFGFDYDLSNLETEIQKIEFHYYEIIKPSEDSLWKDNANPIYNELHKIIHRCGYEIRQSIDQIKFNEEKRRGDNVNHE